MINEAPIFMTNEILVKKDISLKKYLRKIKNINLDDKTLRLMDKIKKEFNCISY